MKYARRLFPLKCQVLVVIPVWKSITGFTPVLSSICRFKSANHGSFISRETTNFRFSSGTTSFSLGALDGQMLLSVEECLQAVKDKETNGDDVVFVDGSWHLGERDARTEYEKGPRIKGAKFFDIDDVASKGPSNPKNLPHMRPPIKLFASMMDALGIKNSDRVIIYGMEDCAYTHRAAYTFKSYGHDPNKVHLMQGSVEEWKNLGGEVETGRKKSVLSSALKWESENSSAKYTAQNPTQFYDMKEVLEVVNCQETCDTIIVDARSKARFDAQAPEPRAGVRGGHMPGSFNIPFMDVLERDDVHKVKSVVEIEEIFASAGVDVTTEKNIVLSCGSGVTACVLATALEVCGRDPKKTFVYDGSWADWGSDPDTPIEPS